MSVFVFISLWLQEYFSHFQWFRKRQGGVWYRTSPDYDLVYGYTWSQHRPAYRHHVLDVETYGPKHDD